MRRRDWYRLRRDIMRMTRDAYRGVDVSGFAWSFHGIFSRPDYLAYVSEADGFVSGMILGEPSDRMELCGMNFHCYDRIGPNSAYVISVAVDPPYQGRGIGSMLLGMFIKGARSKRFASVSGHFRPGRSADMMRRRNPEIQLECPNYCGTGETFLFCRLSLK